MLQEARPIQLSGSVVSTLVDRLMAQFVPALRALAVQKPGKIGNKVWAQETITIGDVRGKKRTIAVTVVSVARKGIRGLFLGAVYSPRERAIQATFNGNLPASEIVPLLQGSEMSSVRGAMKYALMHEITHAKDVLPRKTLEQHIAALLQQEPPARPFSDREMAILLKSAGVGDYTARAISKKRQEMGIGSSGERLNDTLAHLGVIEPPTPQEQRTKEQKSRERYYNSPVEVKAYMQEIAAQVVDMAGGHRAKFYAWPASQVLTFLLKQSNTWNEIKDHLNKASQNRIKKGVVTALRDAGFLGESTRVGSVVDLLREIRDRLLEDSA